MKTATTNKIGDDEEATIQVAFNLVSHVVSSPLNERLQSVRPMHSPQPQVPFGMCNGGETTFRRPKRTQHTPKSE